MTEPEKHISGPSHLAFWPHDRPLPTDEEMEIARAKYAASITPGDMSDYACGILEFVMATFGVHLWIDFFDIPPTPPLTHKD